MFEKASRLKLRFPFRGVCTTEDLWDLSLESLDSIYKTLNKELKATQEDSLLQTSESAPELTLRIEIIKHVVAVKRAEAESRRDAAKIAQQKQHLLSILAQKQESDLQSKSVEELQKMLADLG